MVQAEPYGMVKRKMILFGCDNWGTVLHELMPYKNRRGIWMKQYLIIPGDHMVTCYPWLRKPGALDRQGAIWREYPTYHVTDENPSRTNAIVRVDCAFDGKETPQTNRYKKLTNEIDSLWEELETKEIALMHKDEQIKDLVQDPIAFLQKVAEISQMMKKGERSGQEDYPMPPPPEPA